MGRVSMMALMRGKLEAARLYGILDLGYVAQPEVSLVAEGLLDGGVDLMQLRAKGADRELILEVGRVLRPLCREAAVPFIVNDFPDLALELEADGLHLGQDDGSLEDARAVVGAEMLVGRSTHSLGQARAALAEGFDCIGFGPLFPTPTKQGRPGIGMEDVAAVQSEVGGRIPVFCIGGIKRENLPEVLSAGAQRVVIVSDLLRAANVRLATSEVKRVLSSA